MVSIVELPTFLRVEVAAQSRPGESLQLYREAAVRCVAQGLTRALIVATDQDPEVHETLKSTLRAMAVAGCAAGFRFALVAKHAPTAAIYEAAAAMGRELGLDVRALPTEEEAIRWLHAPPGPGELPPAI